MTQQALSKPVAPLRVDVWGELPVMADRRPASDAPAPGRRRRGGGDAARPDRRGLAAARR
jgi:hypothetical protein